MTNNGYSAFAEYPLCFALSEKSDRDCVFSPKRVTPALQTVLIKVKPLPSGRKGEISLGRQ